MLSRREIQDTHRFQVNREHLVRLYERIIDALIESEVRVTHREEVGCGVEPTVIVLVKVTGFRWQLNEFAVRMAGAPGDTYRTGSKY